MTTRRIGQKVDTMKEEILEELDPEERFELYQKQVAKGESDQADTLDETAPKELRLIRDPEYVKRRIAGEKIAKWAQEDLFRWLSLFKANALRLKDCESDSCEDEMVERTRCAGLALCRLLHCKSQYDELASEELGVSLEELLTDQYGESELLRQVNVALIYNSGEISEFIFEYTDVSISDENVRVDDETQETNRERGASYGGGD